jgi:hypothetical protein
MTKKKKGQSAKKASEKMKRESGLPGGGKGRVDVVGSSGVYPISGPARPKGGAPLRNMASWGQGDRGAAGYEDSGGSGLVWREGQLLGGLTSGGAGEPTIDIHAPIPRNLQDVPQLPHAKPPAEEDTADDDEC